MNIQKVLSDWGLSGIGLLAGLFGGLLKVTYEEKQVSAKSAISQLTASILFAGYGTEFVVKWLHFEVSPAVCGLFGLCLGIVSMFLVKGVIKYGERFGNDPDSFISKKGGPKDDVANN